MTDNSLNRGFVQLALNRMDDAKKHLEEVISRLTPKKETFVELQRKDLDKVKPKFRKMVQDAWDSGESVPYSVIYLSDAPLSKSDIKWAKNLIKTHKLDDDCCKECNEKQKVIDTLQNTCQLYEARIKRFQTLSRKRKNEARRSIGFDEKLVVQYGEQTYRDKKSNGNSLEHNSWSNAEVAFACGQIEEVDREKFRLTILRYARTHKFPKNFF